MKRLKKMSYSYSQGLMDYIIKSGKEILTVNYNRTNKIGDIESQDEEINVNIGYYIKKEDLEYVTQMEVNEEQWENFYSFLKSISIVDFDDCKLKLNYDLMDDISRSLPNEDLKTYEFETFKFKITTQDYSDINFILESKLTKLY